MKHRSTDPACRMYKPPTGWLSRRRHDRARGRSCPTCMSPAEHAAMRLIFGTPRDV